MWRGSDADARGATGGSYRGGIRLLGARTRPMKGGPGVSWLSPRSHGLPVVPQLKLASPFANGMSGVAAHKLSSFFSGYGLLAICAFFVPMICSSGELELSDRLDAVPVCNPDRGRRSMWAKHKAIQRWPQPKATRRMPSHIQPARSQLSYSNSPILSRVSMLYWSRRDLPM